MPSTLVEALNTLPHLSLSTLWIDTTVKHISQMGKLNLSRFTSASRSHTANVEYGLELVSSQLQCSSCCMRAKKPTAVSCYFSGPASLFNTQCLLNRPHQSARLTAFYRPEWYPSSERPHLPKQWVEHGTESWAWHVYFSNPEFSYLGKTHLIIPGLLWGLNVMITESTAWRKVHNRCTINRTHCGYSYFFLPLCLCSWYPPHV